MPAPRRSSSGSRRGAARPRRRRPVEAVPEPAAAAARGARLTARDMEILRWITRHGVVTPQQVAAKFFSRDGGALGQRAAYRRLAALESFGLIQRDWIVLNAPQVIRATRAGSDAADVGVEPAKLVVAELQHTHRVVTVAEQALADRPRGWELVTERELRGELWRRRRAGEAPRGRMPDGVLVGPKGQRIALEVDETSKRSRDVERIIQDYRYSDDRYDAIWWYAPAGRIAERVRQIVRDNQAADLIEVREWRA